MASGGGSSFRLGCMFSAAMAISNNAVLIGIATDNLPSLYAWTQEMEGIRFDVLSDFYPHGAVASAYGVLRGDGTAERAMFVIDKNGIIRYIDVHDINERPPLEDLAAALDRLPH